MSENAMNRQHKIISKPSWYVPVWPVASKLQSDPWLIELSNPV